MPRVLGTPKEGRMSLLHHAKNLEDASRTRCGKTVAEALANEDDVTACAVADFVGQPDTCNACVKAARARIQR